MASPRPFSFVDLRDVLPPTDEPVSAPVRRFSDDDLSAARAEGVTEGRRLAMETIAADEAAALVRIADALKLAASSADQEHRAAIERLTTVVRLFLDEYCGAFAAEREVEAAQDLLRRLTENSEDRRGATLFVSAKSFERLEARLLGAIAAARVADFVTVDFDHALAPGETRLEWRGGDVRRSRAEIAAAIAALFDHTLEMEPRT